MSLENSKVALIGFDGMELLLMGGGDECRHGYTCHLLGCD